MLHLLRFMRKGVYELLMLEEQDINYPASIARNKRIRMIYAMNLKKQPTQLFIPSKKAVRMYSMGLRIQPANDIRHRTVIIMNTTSIVIKIDIYFSLLDHCCPVKIVKYHLGSNSRNSVLDIQALI